MKDENDIRAVLKLNTESLGHQLEMLTELIETQEKYEKISSLQTKTLQIIIDGIERLVARVEELEKKREYVH